MQDETGGLHDALVQDEAGDPITALEVSLELMDADAIVIRPGVPAVFSLDFDLDGSSEIDGTAYEGAEGLSALADLVRSDVEIPVVAGGMIEEGTLAAETVLARSSGPWTKTAYPLVNVLLPSVILSMA